MCLLKPLFCGVATRRLTIRLERWFSASVRIRVCIPRTYAQQGTVSLIWSASALMERCEVGTELEDRRPARLGCRARNSKEAVSKQDGGQRRTVEVIDK